MVGIRIRLSPTIRRVSGDIISSLIDLHRSFKIENLNLFVGESLEHFGCRWAENLICICPDRYREAPLSSAGSRIGRNPDSEVMGIRACSPHVPCVRKRYASSVQRFVQAGSWALWAAGQASPTGNGSSC